MDVLSEFFERTSLQGRLFYAGQVENTLVLDKPPGTAFIHVVPSGGIQMIQPGIPSIAIDEPTVLFCPSSCRYQLRSRPERPAELICASFQFGSNPPEAFNLGLRETLVYPLDKLEFATSVIGALMSEFHERGAGRTKALNLLFEYLFVLLVRRAVADGRIASGLLFALQDGRLATVLSQIHNAPEAPWTVEAMARLANLSRSRFSARFTEIMGCAPMAYLTQWRMNVAQDLLREGMQIKVIVSAVGYSSQAAFSRIFATLVGCPPAEWLKQTSRADPSTGSARERR